MGQKQREIHLTVPLQYAGARLDSVLAAMLPEFSRSFLQKVLKNGGIRLNGEVVKKGTVRENDAVDACIGLPEEDPVHPEAEDIPLDVLYEDDAMLVINKPAGMVVHPAAGNRNGTLVNALAGRYPEMEEEFAGTSSSARPGIVHRLDKDTSGCLVVAKTPEALFRLSGSFQDKTVTKTYFAIVCGTLKQSSGEIITQIGRHPVDRKKMAVVKKGGKEAITRYQVISEGVSKDGVKASLVRVRILTGRTHQIRVHMAYSGCPVAGDTVYGGAKKIPAPRQMLHAKTLLLPHPVTGKEKEFDSPFPEDFRKCAEEFSLNLP